MFLHEFWIEYIGWLVLLADMCNKKNLFGLEDYNAEKDAWDNSPVNFAVSLPQCYFINKVYYETVKYPAFHTYRGHQCLITSFLELL